MTMNNPIKTPKPIYEDLDKVAQEQKLDYVPEYSGSSKDFVRSPREGETWYHGRGGKAEFHPEKPAWFARKRGDAQWFATNTSGPGKPSNIAEANISAFKPARHRDLASAVKATGVTEKDIAENSPYDGTNFNDYLYVPKVRQHLASQGFDSYLGWDTLENDDIEALVPFSPDQIKITHQDIEKAFPNIIKKMDELNLKDPRKDSRIIGGSDVTDNREPYFKSEDLDNIKKAIDSMFSKGKVYVQSGSPPHGSRIELGPKRGRYYNSSVSPKKKHTQASFYKEQIGETPDPIEEKPTKANMPFSIMKEKVYVDTASGEKPPSGVQLFRGRQGGMFYNTEDLEQGGEDQQYQEDVPKLNISVNATPDLQPSVQNFTNAVSKLLAKLPIEHTDGAQFYLSHYEDLDKCFGQYHDLSDVISIADEIDTMSPEEEQKHFKSYKGEINLALWRCAVIHELGHRVEHKFAEFEWKKEALKGMGRVTRYAAKNPGERFAEAYLYYVHNPDLLEERDPVAYNFMKTKIFNTIQKEELPEEISEIPEEVDNELPEGSSWVDGGAIKEPSFYESLRSVVNNLASSPETEYSNPQDDGYVLMKSKLEKWNQEKEGIVYYGLPDGEDPPEGAQVIGGKRGGRYYYFSKHPEFKTSQEAELKSLQIKDNFDGRAEYAKWRDYTKNLDENDYSEKDIERAFDSYSLMGACNKEFNPNSISLHSSRGIEGILKYSKLPDNSLELDYVVSAPWNSVRGKDRLLGVGAKLMYLVAKYSLESKYDKIVLEPLANAESFYRNIGFEHIDSKLTWDSISMSSYIKEYEGKHGKT